MSRSYLDIIGGAGPVSHRLGLIRETPHLLSAWLCTWIWDFYVYKLDHLEQALLIYSSKRLSVSFFVLTSLSNMTSLPLTAHRPIGKWLPEQRSAIQDWIASKLKQAKKRNYASLDPNPKIDAFQNLVNDTPYLKTLANDMFTQSSSTMTPPANQPSRPLMSSSLSSGSLSNLPLPSLISKILLLPWG